ncbi:LysE/ArgO family amino acid transporter [Paenibacillus thailandensis]|uniref:LysE/ArgO family amino acid transporter n=1 Tax=Paenibacillus thailandensis TaxID=393250 RepID=A0ABW5R357_9BACL
MWEAILHGFVLALGLILPLGAQNAFVFNQGAAHGRFAKAAPVIVAASVCDTLLVSLSVLGISVVVLEHAWIQTALYGAGVCFLTYMGFAAWRSKPTSDNGEAAQPKSLGTRKQVAFAVSVSLLNPHAILDTAGVIGTSSLHYEGSEKTAFAMACILVSWLWFAGLGIAGMTAGKLDPSGKLQSVLQSVSAIVIWGCAVYLGYGFVRSLAG